MQKIQFANWEDYKETLKSGTPANEVAAERFVSGERDLPEGTPHPMHDAIKLEREAAEKFAQAQEVRREQERIIQLWNSMVDQIPKYERRAANLTTFVNDMESTANHWQDEVFNWIDDRNVAHNTQTFSTFVYNNLVLPKLVIPELRRIQEVAINNLQVHHLSMQTFAKKHGLPKSACPSAFEEEPEHVVNDESPYKVQDMPEEQRGGN